MASAATVLLNETIVSNVGAGWVLRSPSSREKKLLPFFPMVISEAVSPASRPVRRVARTLRWMFPLKPPHRPRSAVIAMYRV